MLLFPATFGHGTFPFNAHLNADGSNNAANAQNTVIIDKRRIEPSYREGRDPYQLTTGGALGRVHKGFTALRLQGRILVPMGSQEIAIADKERQMLAAFDPALCALDSPSTDGAYPFDFAEWTADTANYPGGKMPLRYWVRPMGPPVMDEQYTETFRRWALGLIAADPRCYGQTERSLALTPGAPTGNVVNLGTVPAPLKATITMSGAGNAAFTITRGGVSFVLNLTSALAGNVIVAVMDTCAPYGQGKRITKAGVDAFSLKTSAATTWLDAPVGTTSFTISNATNVTSCVLNWYDARA